MLEDGRGGPKLQHHGAAHRTGLARRLGFPSRSQCSRHRRRVSLGSLRTRSTARPSSPRNGGGGQRPWESSHWEALVHTTSGSSPICIRSSDSRQAEVSFAILTWSAVPETVHTRAVPSLEAVTTRVLSGLNESLMTLFMPTEYDRLARAVGPPDPRGPIPRGGDDPGTLSGLVGRPHPCGPVARGSDDPNAIRAEGGALTNSPPA